MKFKKKLYGSAFVNQFVAKITGQHHHHRPYAWVRGREKYSHITGGIALPTFENPGFLLTVGVRNDESHIFDCIEEYQSDSERSIIDRVHEIQEEYGYGVIETWWGNPEDFMSLINERGDDKNRVIVSEPVDNDQSDAFQIFTARLRVALSEENQTLFLNKCDLLRNHILSFVREKSAKADNNPAIFVAGALVHTLLMTRPWEHAVEVEELIPTTIEDYAEYEHGQEMRRLESFVWGDV